VGKKTQPDPTSLLPLKPAVFEILLSLDGAERHGYALRSEIAERTRGRIALFPAQLYRYLRRMVSDGVIEEIEEPETTGSEDERRRYYRLTPFGRLVARAELKRLEEVLLAARGRFQRARRTSG
jgi:DNA-binding PadR family transcriptional regulator